MAMRRLLALLFLAGLHVMVSEAQPSYQVIAAGRNDPGVWKSVLANSLYSRVMVDFNYQNSSAVCQNNNIVPIQTGGGCMLLTATASPAGVPLARSPASGVVAAQFALNFPVVVQLLNTPTDVCKPVTASAKDWLAVMDFLYYNSSATATPMFTLIGNAYTCLTQRYPLWPFAWSAARTDVFNATAYKVLYVPSFTQLPTWTSKLASFTYVMVAANSEDDIFNITSTVGTTVTAAIGIVWYGDYLQAKLYLSSAFSPVFGSRFIVPTALSDSLYVNLTTPTAGISPEVVAVPFDVAGAQVFVFYNIGTSSYFFSSVMPNIYNSAGVLTALSIGATDQPLPSSISSITSAKYVPPSNASDSSSATIALSTASGSLHLFSLASQQVTDSRFLQAPWVQALKDAGSVRAIASAYIPGFALQVVSFTPASTSSCSLQAQLYSWDNSPPGSAALPLGPAVCLSFVPGLTSLALAFDLSPSSSPCFLASEPTATVHVVAATRPGTDRLFQWHACLSLSTGGLASVSSPLLPGAPSSDLRSSLAVGNLPSLASALNGTAIRYFAVFGRAMCLEGLQKYTANSGWLKVCQPGLYGALKPSSTAIGYWTAAEPDAVAGSSAWSNLLVRTTVCETCDNPVGSGVLDQGFQPSVHMAKLPSTSAVFLMASASLALQAPGGSGCPEPTPRTGIVVNLWHSNAVPSGATAGICSA